MNGLNIEQLSPMARHALYVIIKQWLDDAERFADDPENAQDALSSLLDTGNNDISYLCAEHRPDLAKMLPTAEQVEKVLCQNGEHDLFIDIADAFDGLFLDEYESMQARLRTLLENGYSAVDFDRDARMLMAEYRDVLSAWE